MILALQAAPLVVLLGLLLSGRAGPVVACLLALAVAVPAVAVSLDGALLGFLGRESLRGAYLAAQPVAVLTGGLLFHAAVGSAAARAEAATPRRILAATMLGGAFVESVVGFGIGAVFALAALRAMGLRGALAGAMALLSLTLVPWGALGPGTALGAALIGRPAQEVAEVAGWMTAPWLLCLGPVLWHLAGRAGFPVPAGEKLAQAGIIAAMAAILLMANRFLPYESAGILASGVPLVAVLYRLDPPRGTLGWRRAILALAPWGGLALVLLVARSWYGAPAWKPYADLPAVPVTHVAVVVWLAAGVMMLLRGQREGQGLPLLRATLDRAKRPMLAMLLYVVLARWMAVSGAAAALALALAAGLGPAAAYAIPPLGFLAGIITGSNVGSNSALMTIQAALGQAAGLPPWLAPGVQNFVGSSAAGVSFGVTALICGLLGDGTRPVALWRALWPSMATIVVIGWIAIALLG